MVFYIWFQIEAYEVAIAPELEAKVDEVLNEWGIQPVHPVREQNFSKNAKGVNRTKTIPYK